MKNKRIVVVSDFSFKGSGYLNIVVPLCSGLAKMGHEVKAVGFGYNGEEHNFPFSILPCPASYGDAQAFVNNLKYLWNTNVVIVAMDIPQQEQFIHLVKNLGMKYIAITPLENPPLTLSWANMLSAADKVFFISQLGADEANLAGLEAEHLFIGMDTESWREHTPEEYQKGRQMMNISPETLVIISVADNQERKNLSKSFEIVSKLKKEKGIKVKYLLVTTENSSVGWKLRDLAMTYGIASELMIFERGISFKELYSLYAISDVYLSTSKAEGLGMGVMEAMSIGVPVVATNCGAMPELLTNELGVSRGLLMDTEYSMIDPWGNSRRDFPDADSGVALIESIHRGKDGSGNLSLMSRTAREYMETRDWEIPLAQVQKALESFDEQE